MRDSESGPILRVSVLLVQQRLRCCATVRDASALMSLESCEYVHILCGVPAATIGFADPASICRMSDSGSEMFTVNFYKTPDHPIISTRIKISCLKKNKNI